jgi:MbtH protein
MTPDEVKVGLSRYKVVVNHEQQYSIWPEGRNIPLGWEYAGKVGTKEECLSHINSVWTDMRPLSLRKKMEEQLAAKILDSQIPG